jgi:hypothetical protein
VIIPAGITGMRHQQLAKGTVFWVESILERGERKKKKSDPCRGLL